MEPNTDREAFGIRAGARTTQRRGRMTEAKRATLAELGPRWLVSAEAAADPAALDVAFGRRAPRLLDVGGGTGEATRAWADDHPDHDVVALELHRPGIARLVRDLEGGGPANLRVAEADATAVLDQLRPGTYRTVRVLFPDPWPKRRHVARRLVDPDLVRRVTDLLPPGGRLHLATDWPAYADQMRAALAADDRLDVDVVDRSGAPVRLPAHDVDLRADELLGRRAVEPDDPHRPPPWRSPRPPRPITAYEQRGIDAGRAIIDLVAHRAR